MGTINFQHLAKKKKKIKQNFDVLLPCQNILLLKLSTTVEFCHMLLVDIF